MKQKNVSEMSQEFFTYEKSHKHDGEDECN